MTIAQPLEGACAPSPPPPAVAPLPPPLAPCGQGGQVMHIGVVPSIVVALRNRFTGTSTRS